MSAVAEQPAKREQTALEIALSGDPEQLIDARIRELQMQERISDAFLTAALKQKLARPDEFII